MLLDLPQERTKEIEDAHWKLVRHSKPTMHYNQNRVDVQFDITIEERLSGKKEKIREIHRMRYLFLPELEVLLNLRGFGILSCSEWMSNERPSEKSWNVVVIANKI